MTKIVAEIGCNHLGDLAIAKQMIAVAKNYCGAEIVKFQKRNPRELLSEEEYLRPHPEPHQSYGNTYGEHREKLEFSFQQHWQLKQYCEEIGLTYACSVWDLTSARDIVCLDPEFIKVPSACNLNFKILSYLCSHYDRQIHLSLGMTTLQEEEKIIKFFEQEGRLQDLVLYACTSGYPIDFKDANLLEISRLRLSYGNQVAAIGVSGHWLGIAVDIAAITLGAEWLERHWTLNRTWKGTDHAASLEPDGLRKLIRDIRAVELALNYKQQEILDVEIPQRQKLKRL